MLNPYSNLFKTIWHYGAAFRSRIVLYYLAFIVAQAILSMSPYAFGRAIDLLQHFNPDQLFEISLWLGAGVLVMVLFWLFHGPARVLERRVALKIQQAFRLSMYEKLSHLPLSWHQNHHSGNTITCLNRASLALMQFSESQFIYIEAFIRFFMALGFLIWISVPLGLLALITSVAVAAVIVRFDKKLIPIYRTTSEIDNRVGAVLLDYISNMTTVLTLRLGQLTQVHLFQRMQEVWPFFKRETVLNEAKWGSMMSAMSFLQALLSIGYLLYIHHQGQAFMMGSLVMLFRYQMELSQVFHDLSFNYSELVRMNAHLNGMQSIWEDMERLVCIPQGVSVAKQWHQLEISHLNFSHATNEIRGRLLDVGFTIKRGEKIALIGGSGAGKSTLLNLLSGLYQPSCVKLKVDEFAFDSLEPLQAITTLIPQDPEIFENTLHFNITLDLPIEPEVMEQVLTLSGFSSVVKNLPQGLETDIREKGLNFSVGQKQRLALTRGLFAARLSSLILMDEPTSSVDLATEKEILTGVIHTFSEAALIVSLHRLHLLPLFDSILMLQEGSVVAYGPTKQLLNQPGPVHDLWQAYQEHFDSC